MSASRVRTQDQWDHQTTIQSTYHTARLYNKHAILLVTDTMGFRKAKNSGGSLWTEYYIQPLQFWITFDTYCQQWQRCKQNILASQRFHKCSAPAGSSGLWDCTHASLCCTGPCPVSRDHSRCPRMREYLCVGWGRLWCHRHIQWHTLWTKVYTIQTIPNISLK